jgi:hypothetical protein
VQKTLNRFQAEIVSSLPILIGHLGTQAHVILDDEAKKQSRFADINILGTDVLEKIFPTWPDSLGEQLTTGLRLTARDLQEDDIFTSLSNEDPVARVFDMIASVLGPEYTEKMKANHIRALEDSLMFTVGGLRTASNDTIRAVPVPNLIQDLFVRVRK